MSSSRRISHVLCLLGVSGLVSGLGLRGLGGEPDYYPFYYCVSMPTPCWTQAQCLGPEYSYCEFSLTTGGCFGPSSAQEACSIYMNESCGRPFSCETFEPEEPSGGIPPPPCFYSEDPMPCYTVEL